MGGYRELAVLGADPGPTTGLALAAWASEDGGESWKLAQCLALECTGGQAPALAALLLSTPYGRKVQVAGLEKFVARNRSASLRGVSAAAMNTIIADLKNAITQAGARAFQRPAGEVKPWADDRRLALAGLAEPTEKFTDARDAARHALFTACQLGLPDPVALAARKARGARSS